MKGGQKKMKSNCISPDECTDNMIDEYLRPRYRRRTFSLMNRLRLELLDLKGMDIYRSKYKDYYEPLFVGRIISEFMVGAGVINGHIREECSICDGHKMSYSTEYHHKGKNCPVESITNMISSFPNKGNNIDVYIDEAINRCDFIMGSMEE